MKVATLLKMWIWHKMLKKKINHHDGEQLFFIKKVTHGKQKDVLVIFILLLCIIARKEERTPICSIKTVLKQENVTCHNSTRRKLTWMYRNWTSKLQVTLLSAYISRKKLSNRLRNKWSWCILRKWGQNEGGCVKELFSAKLQVGISQLYNRSTSSQTVLRDFK